MRRASMGMVVMIVAGAIATAPAHAALSGIHKIQHVVVIMQENRSFDQYFGTYPGANGIPSGVCVPDPLHGGCMSPFHDASDRNYGGPHAAANAISDIDGGKMDGFGGQAESAKSCTGTDPNCGPCGEASSSGCIDVMGYHDAREIPNYWSYAENFVLQDDMFASSMSWSLPEHLFMLSGWSAACPDGDPNPMDCNSSLNLYLRRPEVNPGATYAWTDVTYLLHRAGVSWAYYVYEGNEPDCESDEAMTCAPVQQSPKTPGIWNPLPHFTDVTEDGQLANIQSLSRFYAAATETSNCGLPNVSWIEPNESVSEHPASPVSAGQAYVTTLINAIMHSPCWDSTAIFLSWDDWGGFYDHIAPPGIDPNGYGMRVPGLVISAYAKAGYIDHQALSHDAYLKFIEDDFLGGKRLNPRTDGRPDPRPDVREESGYLGNLASDFDFRQPPRPPLLLPAHPAPGPASSPPGSPDAASSASAGLPERPLLQFAVSVAKRQDLRRHHGRIHMTARCSIACSLYAHGHLNLRRNHRHLGLGRTEMELAGAGTARITLPLSHQNVMAVRRGVRRGRAVEARIAIDVVGPEGKRRTYRVSVVLTRS